MQVDDKPKKVQKNCKLKVVGGNLKHAQEAYNLLSVAKEVDTEVADEPIESQVRNSRRCSLLVSSCVICEELLEGKSTTGSLSNRLSVKSHWIETDGAWKIFVGAVQYVQEDKKMSHFQTLVTWW